MFFRNNLYINKLWFLKRSQIRINDHLGILIDHILFLKSLIKTFFPKIKNIIIASISGGFISGFSVGCFPNKLCIKFNDKKI